MAPRILHLLRRDDFAARRIRSARGATGNVRQRGCADEFVNARGDGFNEFHAATCGRRSNAEVGNVLNCSNFAEPKSPPRKSLNPSASFWDNASDSSFGWGECRDVAPSPGPGFDRSPVQRSDFRLCRPGCRAHLETGRDRGAGFRPDKVFSPVLVKSSSGALVDD